MSGINTVMRLVQSLTKAEKKNFRLFTGFQDGDKAYCRLYDLLCDEKANEASVKEKFAATVPGADLNSTGSYLYSVLMHCLASFSSDYSIEEQLLTGIKEVKVLFRKGLTHEGFRLIDKLRKIAITNEKMAYAVILDKLDLHYKTRSQFTDVSENDLLIIQGRLRKNIMYELNLADHSSLYELLYHRYLMEGTARGQNDKEKLNDLVVTEMNLAGNPRFQSFDLKKNHLLFQSVYFMMIGDNKSSLRTFYELNTLFDNHKPLWNDTPVVYINHIRGIINNLQITGLFSEMSFFITRLEELKKDTAVLLLQQTIYISELKMYLGLNNVGVASKSVANNHELFARIQQLTPTDRAETILYTALVSIHLRNFKHASALLRQVVHLEYVQNHQLRRILRLINLIVHFELHDFNYVTSEIRSLERDLRASKKEYGTEICLMRMMKKSLHALSRNARQKLFNATCSELQTLINNPFEKQMFMIFDFYQWVKGCK